MQDSVRAPMFVSQPAHATVAAANRLDMSRDKGRAHPDDPVQELTFDDVLDIINPLQHLPVISTIYRELTGDKIKPAMQIMGDLGYGGPSGFVLSCLQVLFGQISGDDLGGHVMAFLDGRDSANVAAAPKAAEAPAQVAAADISSGPVAAPEVAVAMRTYGDGTRR